MANASQHTHISPHHAAPCSEHGPQAGTAAAGQLREDREGPSRLQRDMGQSSSEGVAAERG
ncbi:hypothetical protein GCM10010315_39830 [Streptomyces luteosporeus]|uniref:Uncharacterized protein n=1 Tax=Streptomyces luteosporeus TaxID=173856 RepID=A0ABN3TWW0_9ACTN